MPPALSLINSISSPRGAQEASFSITWEHVRNVQAPPQTCWIRNLGVGGGGRADCVVQLVKNPPTMQVTFWPLGWKETLEKERLPTPVFWPGKFHGLYSPWGRKESNTTERLSLTPLTPVILTHPNIWEPQFSTLNSPSLPTEHPFLTFSEKKKTKQKQMRTKTQKQMNLPQQESPPSHAPHSQFTLTCEGRNDPFIFNFQPSREPCQSEARPSHPCVWTSLPVPQQEPGSFFFFF